MTPANRESIAGCAVFAGLNTISFAMFHYWWSVLSAAFSALVALWIWWKCS